jgi:thioredoxin-like negative regulator of GroEL
LPRSSRSRPSAPAHAGLIRALLAAGHKDEAAAALAELDPKIADDHAVAQARAALALAEDAPEEGELAGLRAAAEADADDMDAALAYANGSMPQAIAMPPPRCCSRWWQGPDVERRRGPHASLADLRGDRP